MGQLLYIHGGTFSIQIPACSRLYEHGVALCFTQQVVHVTVAKYFICKRMKLTETPPDNPPPAKLHHTRSMLLRPEHTIHVRHMEQMVQSCQRLMEGQAASTRHLELVGYRLAFGAIRWLQIRAAINVNTICTVMC